MRHHNSNRKLGLKRKGRTALMKTMAVSLIRDEKIVTTEAKAKELRPYIEKIISKSKTDNIAARRLVASRIGQNRAVTKLFKDIGVRYETRKGGYTRITRLARRMGDGSKMAQIELV